MPTNIIDTWKAAWPVLESGRVIATNMANDAATVRDFIDSIPPAYVRATVGEDTEGAIATLQSLKATVEQAAATADAALEAAPASIAAIEGLIAQLEGLE